MDAQFVETLRASVTTGSAEATQVLEKFLETNVDAYFRVMSEVLGSEEIEWPLRQAAGLHIKNAMTASGLMGREAVLDRWARVVTAETRGLVKERTVKALGTPQSRVRTTAAQAVAAIAGIELPVGEWPDVIGTLLELSQAKASSVTREGSLLALGYINESAPPGVLSSQSDQILTAIAGGAVKSETNTDVQYAALHALLSALDFVQKNFAVEEERNYIMQVVCEATQVADARVQVVAFECLVKIVDIYYDEMKMYMEEALYNLTLVGMQHANQDVALQAIEFWSTVCDKELLLEEDIEFGSQVNYFMFAKQAMGHIVPVLLSLLTRQAENDQEDDSDEWNVYMAASTCLSLFAQLTKDAVLSPVVTFVGTNLQSTDWRYRDAAVMAFGSVLGGPSEQVLESLVNQALPTLIELLQSDPSESVRESVAWTLGRASDLVPGTISDKVGPFVQILLTTLPTAAPRIASSCCWSIINLASQEGRASLDTDALSQLYPGILQVLVQYTHGLASNDSNVRASAYEALAACAENAPRDVIPLVQELALTVLSRGEALLDMRRQVVSVDDLNNYEDLQQSIVAVLSSVAQRLGTGLAPLNDRVMTYLLQLLQNTKSGSALLESVFICLGAILASQSAETTSKYVDPFLPHLAGALLAFDDPNLYTVAVGFVGELASTLGPALVPNLDSLMATLARGLNSPQLKLSIKPTILSTMGDIASATGPAFQPYLPPVMAALDAAPSVSKEQLDVFVFSSESTGVTDGPLYLMTLRETSLGAYTSVLHGLAQASQQALLEQYLPQMLSLIHASLADDDRDFFLVQAAVGLLGDLLEAFRTSPAARPLLSQAWIPDIIRDVRASATDAKLKNLAKWAKEQYKALA